MGTGHHHICRGVGWGGGRGMAQPREEKSRRRDPVRGVDSAAANRQQNQERASRKAHHVPIQFHFSSIKWPVMVATLISIFSRLWLRAFRFLLAGVLILQFNPIPEVFASSQGAELAELTFQETRALYLVSTTNELFATRFAKAAFDWAEFATRDREREQIAQQGIEAARNVLRSNNKAAAGHYWLAMNLGQLARTKSIGALPLVSQMEKEFLRAIELDEKLDFAGPHRCLGILYLEAPGWPTSIGNRKKARKHLERSVVVAPEYPDNHLSLLEAYVKWKESERIYSAMASYRKIVPGARETFKEDFWAIPWADWERRWGNIQSAAIEME
ncbi:MAG: hypothetical protein SFY81_07880 [Verrucomicrobiota bacterium]|nr:hypothetical protein [Verrucomicrobiota bacterium]